MLINVVSLYMWYLIVVVAMLFIISGIDDVLLDLFYWLSLAYRKYKKRRYQAVYYGDIASKHEQKIAVFIACWHEYDVIDKMLKNNLEIIDYTNYDIFVGVYPNDPRTINVLKPLQAMYSRLHVVVNSKAGPTSKADNLNNVYLYMRELERQEHVKYNIVVMQDSEDVIHPWAMKFYNYLLPKKDMIQIPVLPLALPHHEWTHWTYADQFAEMHNKELLVREWMHGFIPSAGTSTAFTSSILAELADEYDNKPFNTESLTEDYDFALRLQMLGKKAIFLVYRVKRVVEKRCWYLFGKHCFRAVNELIATYSLFPTRYKEAIRQRARWTQGIAIQEWKNTGWPGGIVMKYLLFHDRKSCITFFMVGFGYICFIYWLIIYFVAMINPDILTLGEFFARKPGWFIVIIIATLIMLWRISQRFIHTSRIYGFLAGLGSIPRVVYDNIMTFHVVIRAYSNFFIKYRKKTEWDKTQNRFPNQKALQKYKRTFGDVALNTNLISAKELIRQLQRQSKGGKKIGELLKGDGALSENEVTKVLAKQYRLPVTKITDADILSPPQVKILSVAGYNWLRQEKAYPIKVQGNVLTLAVVDPKLMPRIKSAFKHLAFKFTLAVLSES